MFDSRKMTKDDFIDDTPVVITLTVDVLNPNSSQFERSQDAYTDVYWQIIQKGHVY